MLKEMTLVLCALAMVIQPVTAQSIKYSTTSHQLVRTCKLQQHHFGSSLHLSTCNLKDNDIPTLVRFINNNKKITFVDLSYNHLTDVGIKALKNIETDNIVNELNLSHNHLGDASIQVINHVFPKLTNLSLSDNQLTTIGIDSLAKMSGLQILDLDENDLNDNTIKSLSKLQNLIILSLTKNKLTDESAATYSTLTNLKELFLDGNRLTDHAAFAITKHLPNLKTLHLGGNNITHIGAKAIATLVNLQDLYLDSNIGEDGMNWISHLPALTHLTLNNIAIKDNKKLIPFLKLPLTDLTMENCNINDEGATILSKIKFLSRLELNNNAIGDKGAIAISQSSNLMIIRLANNDITDRGGSAIAKLPRLILLDARSNHLGFKTAYALSKNKHVELIELANNNIPDAGAIILSKHPKLFYIDLSSNPLTHEGMTALFTNNIGRSRQFILAHIQVSKKTLRAIANYEQFTLMRVNLEDCGIDDEGAAILAESGKIYELRLGYNHITNKGAKLLANWASDKYLTDFSLDHNDIGSEGAIAFSMLESIDNLNLSYNHIGQLGIDALRTNDSFLTVNVEGN